MARHSHRSKAGTRASGPLRRNEALTFNGPGWSIEGADFEVTCWAPGEIRHKGEPTGKLRDEWMLSVERDWIRHPIDGSGMWASGAFVTGDSLVEVLDCLALLEPADRYRTMAILVHELEGEDQ